MKSQSALKKKVSKDFSSKPVVDGMVKRLAHGKRQRDAPRLLIASIARAYFKI